MMLLAIDTSTPMVSLALHDGLSLVAESSWRSGGYHTVELAPNTALMLRRAGLEPGRLQGIAVALGPGSYTGLRIGLGLAKGLALAHNLLLVGVPTFEVLMRAQPPRDERVIEVLYAGRGRISAVDYIWHAKLGWDQRGDIRIRDWASLADEIVEPTYVCGEVDAAGMEMLHKLRHRVTLASPAQSLRRAGYLAEIGWERLRASPGTADDPNTLAPIYGGRPDGAPA